MSNCFVARNDAELFSINNAASSRACVIRFSAGTISLTSPMRNASSAPKILPVSRRSRACFSPTCRKRNVETIAGTKPMRTSVYPNFASGTASVKSQSSASPVPPAIAGPFTAAIVTFGNSYRERNNWTMVWESFRLSLGERPSSALRLSRSSPEQKALPAPVRIRMIASDFATSSNARNRSSINSKLMALRFSGRFNVIVATPPSYASSIVLKFIS